MHLTCTDPQISVVPDTQIPYAGVYIRYKTGVNSILIREKEMDGSLRNKDIIMHELFHCALYEYREAHNTPHPGSQNVGEEMQVQAMTKSVIERLK